MRAVFIWSRPCADQLLPTMMRARSAVHHVQGATKGRKPPVVVIASPRRRYRVGAGIVPAPVGAVELRRNDVVDSVACSAECSQSPSQFAGGTCNTRIAAAVCRHDGPPDVRAWCSRRFVCVQMLMLLFFCLSSSRSHSLVSWTWLHLRCTTCCAPDCPRCGPTTPTPP